MNTKTLYGVFLFCYNLYMYIKEFEKELQEQISPKLHIVRTQPDIAGVYYDNKYLGVTTAPEYVFDCVHPQYTDNPPWWSGQKEKVIFRSKPLLKKLIKVKLNNLAK